MGRPRRNDFIIPTLGLLFDCIAIESSFIFSYWLRFKTPILHALPLTEYTPPFDAYLYSSFFVIPVWLLLFNTLKMYGARRNVALTDEFFNIMKGVTVGMLIVMSAAFFYRGFSYSRVVFVLLWGTSILTISFGRIFLFYIEQTLYLWGRELRNAVIIGNNTTANQMYQELHYHPLLGYKIIGYFADEESRNDVPLAHSRHLGSISDVPSELADSDIELALIALHHDQREHLYRLIQECEGINIEFLLVPDILELMTSPTRIGMKEIGGIPFIKLKGVPMTTWGRILKRTFDITFSSIILTVCSPLFLLIAIAIKLDSKGPVFFKQDRVGLDGKMFSMIKFRSMGFGAEEFDEEAGLGIDNDPRETGVGKILRRTSLDEFPQLINVLQGDMSVVGPRPERPYYVAQFKRLVPKYLDRHRVKTGMTGWAQVNGFRGNTSLEERIKYDIYYIENWSLRFDLKILLKTVKALLFHKPIKNTKVAS